MKQVAKVTVLLILATGSLAKTTQPLSMDSYEGREVNVSCSHANIATSEYIYWYRQVPREGPHFIIQGYKDNVANEVASLFISADRKFSTLSLPLVSLGDSAVYYCIVADTQRDSWVCTCARTEERLVEQVGAVHKVAERLHCCKLTKKLFGCSQQPSVQTVEELAVLRRTEEVS
nr:uncharacterized protein LOC110543161 [Meriones unguiculatus]